MTLPNLFGVLPNNQQSHCQQYVQIDIKTNIYATKKYNRNQNTKKSFA